MAERIKNRRNAASGLIDLDRVPESCTGSDGLLHGLIEIADS